MILQNVTICDIDGTRHAAVRIEKGRIVEEGAHLKGGRDVAGLILMPALVDANVRVADGRLTGANLAALAAQARKGGVGTAVLMPDTDPAVDDTIALEFVQNQQARCEGSRIEPAAAATIGDERFSDIAVLLGRGAAALYMTTAISNHLAVRIAEYVKMFGGTLFCRALDRNLSANGVMVEGAVATRLGLVGIPPLGETVHVARMIEIAREYDISIVFKSVAAPRSIDMIAAARAEGVDVRCEVSVHHLLASDEACDGFNTVAKLDPPLPTEADRLRLLDALKAGKIDMLTSLHRPSSPVNKQVAFAEAAYGCESIADMLPLLYTRLVIPKYIDGRRLVELCVRNPAATIGKTVGSVDIDTRSDLLLFDPNERYLVDNPGSLYHGQTLRGRIVERFSPEN